MTVEIKSPREIELMRTVSRLAAETLLVVGEKIRVGMTTQDIDRIVHEHTLSQGARPAPLNYKGFPKSVCTSVNDVVCHGIPDATVLKNGDIVEILTSAGHHPSRDGLALAVTNKARAKIRHYLNIAERQQALEIGRKHFERELKHYDLTPKKVEAGRLEALAQELGAGARADDLLTAIGYGKVSPDSWSNCLAPSMSGTPLSSPNAGFGR